ncbi:hypothetical protein MSG28_008015 [Choristoneura fumiferana]|uniref:Uncharacterized protein n=1 Tax=Choristoneura fumiferana TaxID=7141 RepID=A0ACC0J9R9_CHOFU|nr:hypothetical protein MSG28_008015 [Choristoneura fumiferana]
MMFNGMTSYGDLKEMIKIYEMFKNKTVPTHSQHGEIRKSRPKKPVSPDYSKKYYSCEEKKSCVQYVPEHRRRERQRKQRLLKKIILLMCMLSLLALSKLKDIGYLLQKVETEKPASPDLEQVTITIEQHFSKLSAEILTHKREVLGIIEKLKDIEKDSLVKAKHDVAKAIKDSNNVMSSLKTALSCQENTLVNVSTLLNDAKNILTKPWVTVNDDLCMLISDYIQLEGNAKAQYKLRASHELGGYIPPPPLSPVFPPLLLKDAGNKNIETTRYGIPEYEPEFTIVNGTNEILQALNATNKNGETANVRPPDAKEIPKCGPEIILNGANDDQQTPG